MFLIVHVLFPNCGSICDGLDAQVVSTHELGCFTASYRTGFEIYNQNLTMLNHFQQPNRMKDIQPMSSCLAVPKASQFHFLQENENRAPYRARTWICFCFCVTGSWFYMSCIPGAGSSNSKPPARNSLAAV